MCRCGKHLFVSINEGTCFWCGYGDIVVRPCDLGRIRLRRLPRDLGALQREGRRPDPHLDNVVRLDRLRDRWMVPPIPESRVDDTFAGDWPELEQAA